MLVHCSAGVGRSGVFIGAHSIFSRLRSYLKAEQEGSDRTWGQLACLTTVSRVLK